MPFIVAFIVLTISITTLSGLFGVDMNLIPGLATVSQFAEKQEASQPKTTATPKQTTGQVVYQPTYTPTPMPPKETKPVPSLLDTYILYGPRKDEVISDTNEVVFEFGGEKLSEEARGEIYFQTKVLGLDNDWQTTHSQERTVIFPGGQKQYTFLVRAKTDNAIDLTPAQKSFTINISPYFGKVRISSLKQPDFYKPSLITLSANSEVNITGWEFKAKYGSFKVSQGIGSFNPLTQPQALKDIILNPGDIVYISTEQNPLGMKDYNFKPNQCMGYLNNVHDFPIPIYNYCPKPRTPLYLEDCCEEYINTLGTCQSPRYQEMKEYNVFEDSNCMGYIESTFNYSGCFINFSQDSGFTRNEWHIYLNRESAEIMDREIDTLSLKDKNGLLVDSYTYGCTYCKSN